MFHLQPSCCFLTIRYMTLMCCLSTAPSQTKNIIFERKPLGLPYTVLLYLFWSLDCISVSMTQNSDQSYAADSQALKDKRMEEKGCWTAAGAHVAHWGFLPGLSAAALTLHVRPWVSTLLYKFKRKNFGFVTKVFCALLCKKKHTDKKSLCQ